jgi:hypothetical protein
MVAKDLFLEFDNYVLKQLFYKYIMSNDIVNINKQICKKLQDITILPQNN